MIKKILLSLGVWLISATSFAFQPLPADQAFVLSAQSDARGLNLHWSIAPGYYLYRDRFSFIEKQKINNIHLPAGLTKNDEMLGQYEVYEHAVTILIPQVKDLLVQYQGCAASGFCYPVITKRVSIQTNGEINIVDVDETTIFDTTAPQDKATELLAHHNWLLILFGFLGFGLLLAFTPCVLPLLPILSGIIVGQGANLTTKKAFFLSLTYVLAMAIAYAVAGVVAGLAGGYVQAFLQNPWVLGTFSLVFVLLALSLFGLYELQLPARWQEKLTQLSNRQSGGTYLGVAIMGVLSTLIVSPCVTAPLIGALTYIGNTGDAVLGGFALFAMGLGFGIPLLIVGTLGGKFLPKAGRWMNIIKVIFGILMLLIAGWLLTRIPVVEKLIAPSVEVQTLSFKKIKSVDDLNRELAVAKVQHKAVMLDFYADWCIACKKMARTTFRDPQVHAALKNVVLLQADVTANDTTDRALEKQWNVIAPPTIMFFDQSGKELKDKRIVGEMNAEEFLEFLCKKLATITTCVATH